MTHVRWRGLVAAVGLAAGLALTSSAAAWAQATGSVTGRVTDRASGRPLEGAEVGVAGTNIRVSTDAEGRFTVPRVPAGAQTLRALMIGYTRLEASVNLVPGQAQTVDFTLAAAAMQLDEVVVTGQPGRTEKRTLGNSVSKIDASNIAEARVSADVQDILTGRTPGLTVIANSGQAGAGSNFRIRGAGSLEAGYQPVYYVDGIRFEARLQSGFGTGNSTVQPTNPLSFINPDDIESVEVIKGPSAATLYGADAAGGVIQIITKKGRRGAGVQWTFGAESGQSEWTPGIGNPKNYWLCKPAEIAQPLTFPGCAGMDSTAPETQRLLVHDPLREDFMADGRPVIRKANLYKFDLSARGGGDFFNYYLSFDRYSEDGVFWNNFDRRLGGRANIEFTPSEKLDVGVTFGYVRNNGAQPLQDNASNGILRNAFRGRKGPAPSVGIGKDGWRGFSPDLSNSFDNKINIERTTIGLTGNWRPFSFMQNRITLGMDKQDLRNTQFYTIDTTGLAPWGAINATGVISHFMPTTHVWTADLASTINFDISSLLTSSFSGGMQLNARSRRTFQASGEGLVANTLNLVSTAAVRRGEETFTEQTSLGFYAQEQVGWRERMYLTAALRVDDNSAFGSDFSLVYYPKASLSWVVSEEEFFPLAFLVDQMKLRLAWGKAGQAPSPFSADRTFTTSTTTVTSGTAEVTANQLTPSAYGNPLLKAEEGQEFEGGFDASMLDGKLGLEFTYYNKATKDALIGVPDPPSSGFGSEHLENVGEVSNKGLELLLTATPMNTNTLSWDATVLFSTNSNKLVSFGGVRDTVTFGAFATVQKHVEGKPLGGFWYNDVQRDASGNLIVDASGIAVVDINKYTYVGPAVPTREAAFTNTLTLFGNLRLFAHLDYKGGFFVWCALCSVRNRIDQNTIEVNDPAVWAGHNPGIPAQIPEQVAIWKSLQTRTHIMKGDFLKLREVSVSYTLPSSWSRAFRANRVTMTVSGRNLKRWSDYAGTGDPEVNFSATSDFTRLDYASVPPMRQLYASVRITF